jgi:hypothetical protein
MSEAGAWDAAAREAAWEWWYGNGAHAASSTSYHTAFVEGYEAGAAHERERDRLTAMTIIHVEEIKAQARAEERARIVAWLQALCADTKRYSFGTRIIWEGVWVSIAAGNHLEAADRIAGEDGGGA